jgi:hypothetical protein
LYGIEKINSMIIFGVKSKQKKEKFFKEPKCTNCNEGPLKMTIYQSYFHFFWIPTFPISKPVECECIKCKKKTKGDQMPYELKASYLREKEIIGKPITLYSGIFVIALILIFIFTSGNERKELFESPLVGDVYKIRDGSQYFYLKIKDIYDDSTTFFVSNYTTDVKKYVTIEYLLNRKGKNRLFSYTKATLTKEEVNEIYGDIREIYRKEKK